MINLLDLTIEEMEEFMKELGEPRFRARQVFDWIYKSHVSSISEMANLPKSLRDELNDHAEIGLLEAIDIQVSKSDGTRKYLFGLGDGNAIETVFMKYKYGNSVCISSQAGCRMGCKFCASTIKGLERNLTAGEMIGQILTLENLLREEGEENWRIGHIVVMGTGEPFDNYDNLSKFLNLAHSESALNISMRNITVSTCGLVPFIERFGEDFPQVNLAISLHSASDEKRSNLMPINNSYGLEELIPAIKKYTETTHRRVTFEYLLSKGVNDSDDDAEKLIRLISGMLCHVNIIPLNEVKETGLLGVSRQEAEVFKQKIEKAGIPATLRRELGSDIDAACGQLRLSNTQ